MILSRHIFINLINNKSDRFYLFFIRPSSTGRIMVWRGLSVCPSAPTIDTLCGFKFGLFRKICTCKEGIVWLATHIVCLYKDTQCITGQTKSHTMYQCPSVRPSVLTN
jgi:hypothetical protein